MIAGAQDQFGRRIEYLRISVTDRCNFRCAYCMPLEGLPWLPREDILTLRGDHRGRAPARAARRESPAHHRRRADDSAAAHDARLDAAARCREFEDIALSTNGVKLPEMAAALKEAGLDRVNMSADSLRPDRIRGDRAPIAPLLARRRRDGGRARGARAGEDQHRRDARHQRRRGRGFRAAHAGASRGTCGSSS